VITAAAVTVVTLLIIALILFLGDWAGDDD